MKVLFVVSSFYPTADANTVVAFPYIEKLKEKYDIDIMAFMGNDNLPLSEKMYDMNVYRYTENNSKLFRIIENNALKIKDNRKDFVHALWKIICRLLFPLLLFVPKFKNTRYALLNRLLKKNDYYAIVTVKCDFENPCMISKFFKKIKRKGTKFYQMVEDPWSEYIGIEKFENKEIIKQTEEFLYKHTDKIFIYKVISDNPNDIVNAFSEKIINIDFPNLKVSDDTSKRKSLLPGKTNIVFSGSIQDLEVRNPEYFFKMISEYNGDKLHFHIVVYRWDEENKKLYDMYLRDNENVSFYYHVSSEESEAMINNADVLVNLGNLCTNQVPSKVYNYIGSCRPIINICQLENDTSYNILKDYPCFLNINETKDDVDVSLKKLIDFSEKNKDLIIDSKLIKSIYKKNLPENASKVMLDNF